MRRLPVYLLLDTSGSMRGEPIKALENGVKAFVASLRTDPYCLETTSLSIITFDTSARQLAPLTDISDFECPSLEVGLGRSLGVALRVLSDCIEKEIVLPTRVSSGDFKPVVYVFIGGIPTDDWEKDLAMVRAKAASITVCQTDGRDVPLLFGGLVDNVILCSEADSNSYFESFQWVSQILFDHVEAPISGGAEQSITKFICDGTKNKERTPLRRLPVYLLLDTSGSMRGEPIEAVNTGIRVMVSALRQDPHALETVHVSIITFDADAKVVTPLTPLDELQLPHITTPQSGPTHLGLALETLCSQVRREVLRSTAEQKGDWAPYLFVMTDGKPSDLQVFEQQSPKVRALGFANIIGCVAGPKARKEDLTPLCDHVVALDTMDSAGFTSLFKWVTAAISGGNRSMGATSTVSLPPPPPEIQIVL